MNQPLWSSDDSILGISAPELKLLMSKNKIVLINSMSSIEYERQHIPDSINIPLIEMTATDKLPQNKNLAIAFYCMAKR